MSKALEFDFMLALFDAPRLFDHSNPNSGDELISPFSDLVHACFLGESTCCWPPESKSARFSAVGCLVDLLI